MLTRDYLMDQAEKIAQLIAALMKKREIDEGSIEDALSDLTGIDPNFFLTASPELLQAVVSTLDDDNKKVLIVKLLLAIDRRAYGQMHQDVMASIDPENLTPSVKALLAHPRS